MMNLHRILTGPLLALLVLAADIHAQVTLSVPSTSYPSIQSAIAGASSGDTVQVGPGTYFENINFQGKAITVIGAGMGASVIDGNQNGSVVTFENEERGATLEGFTITNGVGTGRVDPASSTIVTWGGGIQIWGPGYNVNFMDVVIKNCEITGNLADRGAGAAVHNWGVGRFLDCDVHANGLAPIPGAKSPAWGGGILVWNNWGAEIRRCHVHGNTAEGGGGLYVGAPASGSVSMDVVDCVVENNTVAMVDLAHHPYLPLFLQGLVGGGVIYGGNTLEGCIIRGNVAIDPGIPGFYAAGGGVSGTGLGMHDNLIVDNVAPRGGGIWVPGSGPPFVTNCTIANNIGGGIELKNTSQIALANSIVWGNSGAQITVNSTSTLTAANCDVQGGYPGTGNISADPRFVDAARGDYHLRGDSPCVDRGDPTAPLVGAADFEGDPRLLYGTIDVGADEMADVSRRPAAAGSVGTSGGGPPEKILRVAGKTGGRARRVAVGVNKKFRISVLRPSANTGLARFAVYGLLRAARYDDVLALPAGIGSMAFPPCILLPSLQPTLFTLTNNFPLGPCGQLVASTPAPWTSADIKIPIPITFTVQGLIEETPGVVRTTNAVIVEIR